MKTIRFDEFRKTKPVITGTLCNIPYKVQYIRVYYSEWGWIFSGTITIGTENYKLVVNGDDVIVECRTFKIADDDNVMLEYSDDIVVTYLKEILCDLDVRNDRNENAEYLQSIVDTYYKRK